MTPEYIDSHAHLYYDDYRDDLDAVLSRAKNAGVKYYIVPGTDVKSSKEVIRLSERQRNVYACVGVHPHEAAKVGEKDLQEIEELSKHPKVVAVGEIGLDYHYNFSPPDRQKDVFAAQLEIAVKRNLPAVIHTRESTADAFAIVKNAVETHPRWKEDETKPKRGVFHCFPGTAEEAMYIRRLGFYVSYTGIVTFKNSASIEVVKKIGIENLLLETDSPFMTPVPLRGKRNEPANIVYIGRKIAEVIGISEEKVAGVTAENAIQLFGIFDPGEK